MATSLGQSNGMWMIQNVPEASSFPCALHRTLGNTEWQSVWITKTRVGPWSWWELEAAGPLWLHRGTSITHPPGLGHEVGSNEQMHSFVEETVLIRENQVSSSLPLNDKEKCLPLHHPSRGSLWGAFKCCAGAQSHMGIDYNLGYWHSLWIWFRGWDGLTGPVTQDATMLLALVLLLASLPLLS